MFYIGGEQELAPLNYFQEVTNSGRSSLRLIIESANLRNKHILLPDFLCQVIIDILQEYQVTFDFYSVERNLDFQLPDNIEKYDAVYLIKYFGGSTDAFAKTCTSFHGCLIVDDVFSPYPEILKRDQLWFSFNSLRKISHVADFSLLYSNAPLASVIKTALSGFSVMKYRAKNLKHEYLNFQQGSEKKYLDKFGQAEAILSSNFGIYSPSADSIIAAIQYFNRLEQERNIRQRNYQQINDLLADYSIPIKSKFYSFAPLLLNNRDVVRQKLMEFNVFLAVHWPVCNLVDNVLSQSIISIPVDSRYSSTDIKKVCSLIIKLEGK